MPMKRSAVGSQIRGDLRKAVGQKEPVAKGYLAFGRGADFHWGRKHWLWRAVEPLSRCWTASATLTSDRMSMRIDMPELGTTTFNLRSGALVIPVSIDTARLHLYLCSCRLVDCGRSWSLGNARLSFSDLLERLAGPLPSPNSSVIGLVRGVSYFGDRIQSREYNLNMACNRLQKCSDVHKGANAR